MTLELILRATLLLSATMVALFLLRRFEFVKADSAGFQDGIAEGAEGVGGHGGVIGVPAIFVGFHDRQPFGQIAGEA